MCAAVSRASTRSDRRTLTRQRQRSCRVLACARFTVTATRLPLRPTGRHAPRCAPRRCPSTQPPASHADARRPEAGRTPGRALRHPARRLRRHHGEVPAGPDRRGACAGLGHPRHQRQPTRRPVASAHDPGALRQASDGATLRGPRICQRLHRPTWAPGQGGILHPHELHPVPGHRRRRHAAALGCWLWREAGHPKRVALRHLSPRRPRRPEQGRGALGAPSPVVRHTEGMALRLGGLRHRREGCAGQRPPGTIAYHPSR